MSLIVLCVRSTAELVGVVVTTTATLQRAVATARRPEGHRFGVQRVGSPFGQLVLQRHTSKSLQQQQQQYSVSSSQSYYVRGLDMEVVSMCQQHPAASTVLFSSMDYYSRLHEYTGTSSVPTCH